MSTRSFDVRIINAEIKELKSLFKSESTFEKGKEMFLDLHRNLYRSKMSKIASETYEDMLWEDLAEEIARTAVNEKGRTVLYGLWHATRIEDMTMNMLVKSGEQVYKAKGFKDKINAGIDHTGNSLSHEEILQMSARINIKALASYRLSVGKCSQKIISSLSFADLKRKVKKEDIDRILFEGGVDNVPSANWLLDFWGGKTTQGILFMPASRHQLVHLRENMRAKERGLKAKKRQSK